MLGLARAQFALENYAGACATLDRLRAVHPDLDCPDGHLLYARSKEQQGDLEQALIEFAALAEYFPGEEARCRLALLSQKTGCVAEARTLFQQVVRSVERASKLYYRSEWDWARYKASPDVIRLFYARLDYLLGKSPTWPTCDDYEGQRPSATTLEEFLWLCVPARPNGLRRTRT
jgi:tetratricopeptide (TPR) repeat protein